MFDYIQELFNGYSRLYARTFLTDTVDFMQYYCRKYMSVFYLVVEPSSAVLVLSCVNKLLVLVT